MICGTASPNATDLVANVGSGRKQLQEPRMARFSLTFVQPARQLGSAVHREVLGRVTFGFPVYPCFSAFSRPNTDSETPPIYFRSLLRSHLLMSLSKLCADSIAMVEAELSQRLPNRFK